MANETDTTSEVARVLREHFDPTGTERHDPYAAAVYEEAAAALAEAGLLREATPVRHPRATTGQRVTSSREQNGETWWWECDHAHDTSNGEVAWCGTALTQDAAYTVLDFHNAAHHPHLTEEARRG